MSDISVDLAVAKAWDALLYLECHGTEGHGAAIAKEALGEIIHVLYPYQITPEQVEEYVR